MIDTAQKRQAALRTPVRFPNTPLGAADRMQVTWNYPLLAEGEEEAEAMFAWRSAYNIWHRSSSG